MQAGPCSSGRQDEPDPASRKRSGQSGVDCGYPVVVPLGLASHADRPWADGQAATVHPATGRQSPAMGPCAGLDAIRRADGGTGESDRRSAWPRRARNVSQIQTRGTRTNRANRAAARHFLCASQTDTPEPSKTLKSTALGAVPALDISIDSTTHKILWDKDAEQTDDEPRNLADLFDKQNYVFDPPYLPIRSLPPGSDVVLTCLHEGVVPNRMSCR